jgi:GntR family transcriptional regulator
MFLKLEPNSGEPLYQQIAHQLRLRIAGGILAPNDPLPSARDFAAQLKVNFLTITKVYQILEREGLVEIRRGLGTYVTGIKPSALNAVRQQLLEELAASLAQGALKMGFESEEVIRVIRKKMQQKESHE